jgi:hypothetical protein
MKMVAIITRTLKEGKSYEDYRKVWFHTLGFGVPTAMYTVVNAFNPMEIISIGIMDAELEQFAKSLDIDVKERMSHPMDDVVESTIIRTFGVVAAVDDFSSAGELEYCPPQVDGKVTDWNELASILAKGAEDIRRASEKRDMLRKERGLE